MKSCSYINDARLLPLVAAVVLLISVTGLAIAGSLMSPAVPTNDVWYGFYTDATSYEPGDVIQIYGSAPNS